MRAQKRTMLVKKIKAELDLERLTDILANDFILQDEAGELKETIEKIEKRNKRLYNHKEFVQQVMKKRAQLFQNRNIYKELPENPIEEQIRRLQQEKEKEKEKESKREYALNFNKLRYQQKPFQCFLSSSKKDLSYIKIDNDIKAGPGSYYKEPTYKLVKSKSCVIERMLLQSQKPIIVPKKFDYVGPGSYNIAGNLLKK